LWWGSLSAVGFLVVPFACLRICLQRPWRAPWRRSWFTAQTLGVLCCAACCCFCSQELTGFQNSRTGRRRRFAFVLGGMLLALLAEFAVAPRIVARENLALCHSVGSGLYLVQWALRPQSCCSGLAGSLVFKKRSVWDVRPQPNTASTKVKAQGKTQV